MIAVCIQLVLIGMLGSGTAAPAAVWTSSPMSWSADSQWLSYTVVSDPAAPGLPANWLFDTSRDPKAGVPATSNKTASAPLIYRIWATAHGERSSALISESRWPLTAPSWSPRGKSVAFGRFVPRSSDPHQSGQRGNLEVVVQSALEVQKVVWSSPDIELDPDVRAGIPHLNCSWSADGSFLAIPLPTPQPAVVLVDITAKKRLQTIDRAVLPVWAPDGSKCAYIRRAGDRDMVEIVERRGRDISEPQPVIVSGAPRSAPFWSADGRSIMVVVEKPTSRFLDIALARCPLSNREAIQFLSLFPEAKRRMTKLRGVTIDFDRDSERFFFALDLEGRPFELVSCTPQGHEFQPRFHPLDVSQRIAALAVSPDSKWVATRFGDRDDLSPPAIFDVESEHTVLVVPDESTRKEWLAQLVNVSTRMLSGGLPPASVEGQVARRPSLLPLAGELPALGAMVPRLIQIAVHGASLCPAPYLVPNRHAPAQDATDLEARLFFNFLMGQYRNAEADLAELEPHVALAADRLSVLSLRAQILWSQGQRDRARSIVEYIVSVEGTRTERVEETPMGLVATKELNPVQAWARYLSMQVAEEPLLSANPSQDPFGARPDVMPKDPFDIPDN